MPVTREPWNDRLIQALRRYQAQVQATGKATWHRWKVDADTVEAVKRDIWITKDKNSVKNLPAEGPQFSKRARELCENIMKGKALEVPRGFDPSAAAIAMQAEHPYLRSMEYRGGGYAILMALYEAEQDPAYLGSLTIAEICRRGQRHCNVNMKANHWAGNDHGHGWESNKSLIRYGLITRDNHGRGPASAWRGPVDSVRLTEQGREFIQQMMRKFDVDAEVGAGASRCSNSVDDDNAPGVSPPIPGFPSSSGSVGPKSLADEEELVAWAQSASIGAKKTFNVSDARRRHLHGVADRLSASTKDWLLSHSSLGMGRDRQLVVKKISRKRLGEGSDTPTPGLSHPAGIASASSGGQTLGGPPPKSRIRDLAARAATARMQENGIGDEAPACSEAALTTPARASAANESDSPSDSGNSDDEEAMMQRAMRESLATTAMQSKAALRGDMFARAQPDCILLFGYAQ